MVCIQPRMDSLKNGEIDNSGLGDMRDDTVIIAIAIATLIGAYIFYGISSRATCEYSGPL